MNKAHLVRLAVYGGLVLYIGYRGFEAYLVKTLPQKVPQTTQAIDIWKKDKSLFSEIQLLNYSLNAVVSDPNAPSIYRLTGSVQWKSKPAQKFKMAVFKADEGMAQQVGCNYYLPQIETLNKYAESTPQEVSKGVYKADFTVYQEVRSPECEAIFRKNRLGDAISLKILPASPYPEYLSEVYFRYELDPASGFQLVFSRPTMAEIQKMIFNK